MKRNNSFLINEKLTKKKIFGNFLKERISQIEIKKNPIIGKILEKEKKIRYDLLSNAQPKLINTENIKDEKLLHLINKINSFQEIYYDINKEQKSYDLEISPLKNENNLFTKKFNRIQELNSKRNEIIDKFSEIKGKYYDKGYSHLPNLSKDHNIFTNNILLVNQSDLDRYIIYGLGKKTSVIKSLNFLNKMRDEVSIKRKNEVTNNSKNIFKELGIRNLIDKPEKYIEKKNKINLKKEIRNYSKDLKGIKDTFNNMKKIDNFFKISKEPLSTTRNSSLKNKKGKEILTKSDNSNDYINDLSYFKNKNKKKKMNKLIIQKEKQKLKDINKSFYHLYQKKQKKSINNTQKKINLKFNTPLEKLYYKISNLNNIIKNSKKIEKFASHRNFNVSIKPTNINIFFQIEKNKEKIVEKNFVKENIQLRKEGNKQFELSKKLNSNLSYEKLLKQEIKDYTLKSANYLYDFDKNE